MHVRILFYLIPLSLLSGQTMSQTLLTGKVMDSKSDVPLVGATVFNPSKNITESAIFLGPGFLLVL